MTELDPLLGLLDGMAEGQAGRRKCFSGTIHGKDVAAVVSGVGQANTAQTLAAILEGSPPDLVIMGGCAGAYAGSGMKVGDVAVATEEVFADLGVMTPKGWLSMEETGLPLLDRAYGSRYFNRFPTAFGRYEGAIKAANPGGGHGVFYGPFLTVSAVSGTNIRGDELYGRYHALCENMEGAAAAQVALLYDIPFVEVRGISNIVEDRDKDKWDIPAAAYNCAKFIESVIKNLKES